MLLTSEADGTGHSLTCVSSTSAVDPATPLATAFVGKSGKRTAIALTP